jgi:hypothetical protein
MADSRTDAKGVVYTKGWVVKLILDAAGYLSNSDILKKKIIEPSCGDGSFLVEITSRLLDAFISQQSLDWLILSDCVEAYEIDKESLDRTKSKVSEIFRSLGCPEDFIKLILNKWLKNEDFLLSAGTDADYVIGNPPYVRATDIPKKQRLLYKSILSCTTLGTDLYVAFFEKGLSRLSVGGKLCFICADRWLQNAYGKKIRKLVNTKYNLSLLVRMHGVDVFENEVSAYPSVTLINNGAPEESVLFIDCEEEFSDSDVPSLFSAISSKVCSEGDCFTLAEAKKPKGDGYYFLTTNQKGTADHSECGRKKLVESGINLGIGVATGCDSVFVTEDSRIVEKSRLLPLFYMRDFRQGSSVSKYLVNPWNQDGTLVDLEQYPKFKKYLMRNYDRLAKRYVAKQNPQVWFRTIDKLNAELMTKPLLLIGDMSLRIDPVFSRGKYPHHNCYWLSSDVWDLEVLGGFLISRYVEDFIASLTVKMRGGTLRLQAQYLRQLPLPDYAAISEQSKEDLKKAFRYKDRNLASLCVAGLIKN